MDFFSIRNKYKTWGIVTLVSIYLLILVGGVVRSTGSGMGCPDWPKCFGQWIPPTDVSQLPSEYKEIYSEKRRQKNIKIARVLNHLNFINLSKSLLNNDTVMYQELDFNVTKTWIEYLNRLLGVFVGIFILILTIISLKYLAIDYNITINTVVSFILVGLEGWIGSIVVSTNLLPFAITIHMFLALLLIGILINTIIKSQLPIFNVKTNKGIIMLLYIVTGITFVQILLGSQVRESIDEIAFFNQFSNRNLWIGELGNAFYVHRSFSILILFVNLFILYKIQKDYGTNNLKYKISLIFNFLLWLEVCLGIYMAYFSIPAFSQPLHLFIATMVFGLQFSLLIFLKHVHPISVETKSLGHDF
jgi:heme a synthase